MNANTSQIVVSSPQSESGACPSVQEDRGGSPGVGGRTL